MSALTAGPSLGAALRRVRDVGAAFIPEALSGSFHLRLREHVDVDGYQELPEVVGQVRQEGELLVIAGDMDGHPVIRRLRDELAAAVHAQAPPDAMLGRWDPNEASLQRYRPGAGGITPHRDLKRYRYLIAVFTVDGTATFTHCRNRAGDAVATWSAGPGSLVLLRGPGFGDDLEDDLDDDGRPLHAVSGPAAGQRISLGFRMDTSGGPDAAP